MSEWLYRDGVYYIRGGDQTHITFICPLDSVNDIRICCVSGFRSLFWKIGLFTVICDTQLPHWLYSHLYIFNQYDGCKLISTIFLMISCVN